MGMYGHKKLARLARLRSNNGAAGVTTGNTDVGIPVDRTIDSRTNLADKIFGAESVASTERTYDTSRSSYRSYGTISKQFCFD